MKTMRTDTTMMRVSGCKPVVYGESKLKVHPHELTTSPSAASMHASSEHAQLEWK